MRLITQEERDCLGKFFPNYAITEEQVVIIALAHVQFLNGGNSINIDSEVFPARRVKSRAQRRSLLRRAKQLDYIGMGTIERVLYASTLNVDVPETARGDSVSLGMLKGST
ncbi:hypothetical protein F5Y05DRAFT_381940 [Hypoxylon sp. FL0543]|nr:hypothetical protein F5Y05DRAFT_381940 [Hypoxylon sp. FL0543]